MEDYLQFEEEAFKTPNHGDIVDGIVVRVDPDEVLVDIGAKAEGVISSKELGLRGDTDSAGLEPGDQIKVYVLQPENGWARSWLSINLVLPIQAAITANVPGFRKVAGPKVSGSTTSA